MDNKYRVPPILDKGDLNVLCDLVIVTDAYRSGNLIDYTKLEEVILEGTLGKQFTTKYWPLVKRVLAKSAEVRKGVAESKEEQERAYLQRRDLLFGFGVVCALASGWFIHPFVGLFFGTIIGFVVYVYYRIRIAEYYNEVFRTKSDEGRVLSQACKRITQELIISIRETILSRHKKGKYTALKKTKIQVYNLDYTFLKHEGDKSRFKGLVNVDIDLDT